MVSPPSALADIPSLLKQVLPEEGRSVEELAIWDLRKGSYASKLLGPGADGDVRAFLAAQASARERADAIVLASEDASNCEPSAIYQEVMFGGLLKPGGLMLWETSAEDTALAQMVCVDMEAGVLRSKAAIDCIRAMQLSKSWSPGMPTPSMSVEFPSASSSLADQASGLRQRKPSGAQAAEVAAPEPAAPAPPAVTEDQFAARLRTLRAILCLWACAPLLLLMAACASARHRLFGPSFKRGSPKKQLRVLVTGGKMSKASAVARAVGRDGHKVFTAEIMPYKFCHTRFCTYVSKHYVLPRPTVQPEEWEAAMQKIVKEQSIDLIIPCTAPVESSAYAHLRERLPPHVRVFAFDGDTSDELDNKYTFNQVLVKAGLRCPETANMECTEDAVEFFRRKEESGADDGKRYIIKPAVYDPKARTEILFLPIPDKEKQMEYLRSRNARKDVPYVIQEVLENPEYGSFAIFNKGELTGFEFFLSAASCLVYKQESKHYDAVLELNRGLGKAMNLTGQLTLDLMHTPAGDLVPIECNPRIHSAICTLEGHQNLSAVYADPDHKPQSDTEVVTSRRDCFKFWTMDQLFLMAGFWKPKNCFKLSLKDMFQGTDAILHGDDPMPFLAMYLVQIPSLLALELLSGKPWLKIDFCIGKIVKEGGD